MGLGEISEILYGKAAHNTFHNYIIIHNNIFVYRIYIIYKILYSISDCTYYKYAHKTT